MLSFFPRGVLDEILNLIELVSEDFPSYFYPDIHGYNTNVMRQTACLVVNPIKVNRFAYLFNCTTVGRTSD